MTLTSFLHTIQMSESFDKTGDCAAAKAFAEAWIAVMAAFRPDRDRYLPIHAVTPSYKDKTLRWCELLSLPSSPVALFQQWRKHLPWPAADSKYASGILPSHLFLKVLFDLFRTDLAQSTNIRAVHLALEFITAIVAADDRGDDTSLDKNPDLQDPTIPLSTDGLPCMNFQDVWCHSVLQVWRSAFETGKTDEAVEGVESDEADEKTEDHSPASKARTYQDAQDLATTIGDIIMRPFLARFLQQIKNERVRQDTPGHLIQYALHIRRQEVARFIDSYQEDPRSFDDWRWVLAIGNPQEALSFMLLMDSLAEAYYRESLLAHKAANKLVLLQASRPFGHLLFNVYYPPRMEVHQTFITLKRSQELLWCCPSVWDLLRRAASVRDLWSIRDEDGNHYSTKQQASNLLLDPEELEQQLLERSLGQDCPKALADLMREHLASSTKNDQQQDTTATQGKKTKSPDDGVEESRKRQRVETQTSQ